MRVLIVEDDSKLAALMRRGLTREGMAVDLAPSGEDAVPRAEATEYDAIVLDVMLPGIDGFEVCRQLRAAEVWSPILMLTARDGVRDRVAGLDSGADDYLTKPFSYAELLARLRALFRRGRAERPPELQVGDLRLDPATRRVWRGDTEIELSAKEFSVLETFMRRPGDVLSPVPAPRARLGLRLREPLQRRRRVRRLPAPQDRQAVRRRPRSRRCAAPATACARTAGVEPHPDPPAGHPRLRRGHGRRLRRRRAVRLRTPGRSAGRVDRQRPAHARHRDLGAGPGLAAGPREVGRTCG